MGVAGVQACEGRPYAYEALPDAQLQVGLLCSMDMGRGGGLKGNVRKSIVVSDEAECLSACLQEEAFTCLSVNFVRSGRSASPGPFPVCPAQRGIHAAACAR